MSWHSFRPYVPVAQRQRLAEAAARKQATKTGRPAAPIRTTGRAIATTFWGRAWCDNLEAYSDYANRLPRGRTYVRNGSVIDLQISAGLVDALVQGSSLYTVKVTFQTLPPMRWDSFKQRCAGRVTNLLDLLQGRLSKEILADITTRDAGLFPAPAEIKLGCSCPDWAVMCKHVAAVLYGVGVRLDEKPELFFTLRGVEVGELVSTATAEAAGTLTTAGAEGLAGTDLSALFGVDVDAGPATPVHPARKEPRISKRTPAAPTSAPKGGPARKPGPGPTGRASARVAPSPKRQKGSRKPAKS